MPRSTGGGALPARWHDGPLVGRDALMRELSGAARDAAHGRGAIVLLTGEAGIGKTSVARALGQDVRDELVVTWGTCLPDQGAPPFLPWRPLVATEPSRPSPATDESVGAPRYEQLVALREQLRDLARYHARLHLIEDLQWADVASLLLLSQLGAGIDDVPLLVVATLRTDEPRSHQLDDAIEEVRRVSRVRELPPLDDDDIATLVRRTDTEADPLLIAIIGARTGGNPLLVSELLRAVPPGESGERRRQLLAERVPNRVSDLVLNRLSRLPAEVTDALVTASVIGSEGDTVSLAAAVGTDIGAMLDLLDQARAAQFLDAAPPGRWQFRHQLIRDAVQGSTTERDRLLRHGRALEALAADPSTAPATLAHHALAGLPLFDADRAAALAARAGESAFQHHAYEEAVGWFIRALATTPADTPGRWRAELLVLSGEAHRHTGDIEAARIAFSAASELTGDAALLARCALGYADPGADLGIAYRSDDGVTAVLLDRAIAAQPAGDSLITVQLESRLAAELYFSDDPARARQLADSALERARRLHDPRPLGVAMAVVHDSFVVGQAPIAEQLDGSARLLELAQATRSVAALLTAHRARVFDLLSAGEMAALDTEILAYRRRAEPLRAPGYQWWPALWSAMRALLEGRHDVAEERALHAFQDGAESFPTLAFLNLSFLLFFLRREQGRLDEMEQATREYASSHADVPALRVALAFLLAELGRNDEARSSLDAFDPAALSRLHDRNWPASWFQLARAASIVGHRPLAAVLLESHQRPSEPCVQVSLGTVCLGASDLAVAWLLHAVGDLDRADEHYRAAEELNARIGARSWLAQARVDHARMLVERDRAGDREAAAALDDLGQAAARQIGLHTVAAIVPDHAAPTATARFRRNGSVWEVAFAGRAVQLADARGLRDLRFLLCRPGEAVSVVELAGDLAAPVAAARGARALDERARREIRERLRELDGDEADAEAMGDDERVAMARERRQALAEAVAGDFGLGGRTRMIGDPLERARKTVSTRIRRAIAAVRRVHPELGRHLDRSIDTGAWCAYRPPEPVDWQT